MLFSPSRGLWRLLIAACLALGRWLAPVPYACADFSRDVYPILQRACLDCHGGRQQKGKLRLDTREFAFKGGRHGPVIVPGNAEASELYRRISAPKGSEEVMPARGEPLSPAHIQLVRTWIEQGASWPEGVPSGKHWAYVPPVRPALPVVRSTAWPRTAIDYFILARLEQEGLEPSPEANRVAWLRRVSLDLTGLSPTLQDLDAFLADPSPGAYEAAVDRLLAAPQFGERWARPWLDLAHYADSHGFQRDDLRPIWAYRDWVIRALNADMPFDRFTLEQVAGDLLPGATLEQKIATGFYRCTPTNVEAGSEPEETRINQVIDRVNTTGAAWLGTTLECAQCHDHKYDPFTQKDYYQLFAFLNNTAQEADRADPAVPGSIRFGGPYLALSGYAAKPPEPPAKADGDPKKPPKISLSTNTLVMQELPKPRQTSIMLRGDYRTPGPAVQPGTPAVLPPPQGPPNRLTLARWLTARDNPLTARVTVNRWWAELFGHGIVTTVEDFGLKGEPPTHPELLDWMAVEFMDNGWSLKPLLRQVVLSATYRQTSRLTQALRSRDDQNLLYARGPRFRMDAEMIRDHALAIAGLLSRKQFGPPIQPYQPEGLWTKIGGDPLKYIVSPGVDRYRRGVYVVWKRGTLYPSFVNFDATARLACTVKRSRSNTPLQALTLLNDPVYVEAALALARRTVCEQSAADIDQRIRHAFRLCIARLPQPFEVSTLRKLYASQLEANRRDPRSTRQFLAETSIPEGVTAEEFAAWYTVAAALLNLDETITKG